MALTSEEIDLIRSSFARLAASRARAGEIFYEELFARSPQTRALFTTDISQQASKLMSTLGLVVAQLQNWEDMRPMIEDLAIRHVAYGVRPQHYPLVGDALIAMMMRVLGPAMTVECERAWIRAYAMFSDVMIEAAHPRVSH